MALKSLILLPFLVLGVLSAGSTLQDEAEALKHFKSSITDDPTGALLDWNADSNHHCNWTGIQCHNITKRVVSISVQQTYLKGQISPFLGNLSSLQLLDLSYNSFTGNIPFQLGYCTQLSTLVLYTNSLSGPIPSELGKLRNLQMLDLGNNSITGIIPESLCDCTSLQELHLDSNKLNGTIPDRIGDLVNLQLLGAFKNLLEGSIPTSVGQLKELQAISLDSNKLNGTIPDTIGDLVSLQFLIAFNNLLEGSIPTSVGKLKQLQVLALYQNHISGIIPTEIGNLSSLQQLLLFDNSLSGELPTSIGHLTELQTLDISQNQLSGIIPTEIGNLSRLQTLQLYENSLSGQIPTEIGRCKNLTLLNLYSNKLTGSIPGEIGNLQELQFLRLYNNSLNSIIPRTLFQLKSLIDLQLSKNDLTGNVSSQISSLESLKRLTLHENKLTGEIPASITKLIYLNFSNNFLTGTIPNEFGKMEMVQAVDLSNNNLTGGIPVTFQNCRNLQSLDLSGNQLSGSVPDEIFPTLNLLSNINFSRNQLEGKIPESMANLTTLTSVDLSQNKFNGTIPENVGNNLALKHLNLSFNHLEGRVPDTGIFKNSSAIGLLGNPSLCVTNDTKSCTFSTQSNHSHQISRKAVLILAILGSLALLLVLFLGILCYRHVRKPKVKQSEDPEPKYTRGVTLKRFDKEALDNATDGFSEDNILGTSSLSTVYKGTLADGRMIAVKILNFTEFSAESDKSFNKEMNTLARLRHRNLVKVVGYAWESGKLRALVLEYMENVSRGLVYLHSGYDFPIVHCDLKPSNILLDEKWDAHVSDFGTARILGVHQQDGSSVSSASAFQGTIGYLAPEFAYMRKVTTKVDVFSFGVIIMEFITRKRPTELTEDDGIQITLPQLIEQALSKGTNELIEVVDPDLASDFDTKHGVVEQILQLALCCTRTNPDDRPDMNEILSSLTKISKKV
ncbi:putative protein kinase RLK-Pelle-LRR-XII-1 family [Helianthus annuus]|nr:putative protein kinase RLK-Pelle-LRR-XII-1 family [Helianthus annuus]